MPDYYPDLLETRILDDADRTDQSGAPDGDVTDWPVEDQIILATQIGYDKKDTLASTFKLRWRNVTQSGSFADVGSTGEVKWAATSGVLSDGTALTSSNARCSDQSSMTWQDGEENVNDNLLPDSGTFDLGNDCYTELQWSLSLADANEGDQYEFQLWNNTEGVGYVCGAQITTLTTAVTLTVSSCSHSHAATSPGLVVFLSVSDCSHSNVPETPGLGVHLAIVDCIHDTTSQSPTLVEWIGVANCAHSHTPESPLLTVVLPPNNASHSHAAESPGLVVNLSVNDSSHGHVAQSISVTESFSLVYHQAESTSEEYVTANETFQDKCVLSFTPADNATYLLVATWLAKNESTSQAGYYRFARTAPSELELNYQIEEGYEPTDWMAGVGFCYETFGSSPGQQTYKIQYHSGTSNTVRVKEAKIFALKLGANDKYASSTGRSTTTGTSWVDKATLSSLPAGTWLIFHSAIIDVDAGSKVKARLNVGGTGYDEIGQQASAAWEQLAYGGVKKVTLGSAADVKIQFCSSASGQQVGIESAFIVAIYLDDLPGYYYAENDSGSDTTAQTPQDRTTLTQTLAAFDHFIVGAGGIHGDGTACSNYIKLIQDAANLGEMQKESYIASDYRHAFASCKFLQASAQSYTWKIQWWSEDSSNTSTVRDARIAVLKLEGVTNPSLVVNDAGHSHSADSATLAVPITVNDASHSHAADPANLIVTLSVADSSHSHGSDAVTLTQTLSPDSPSHGHAAEGPVLGIVLVAGDCSHGHSAEAPDLVQVLSPSDCSHGHAAGSPVLRVVLVAGDCSHGHAAENLDLEEIGTVNLTVQDSSHSHAADEITFGLGVADSSHAHAAGSPGLVVFLDVQGAGHSHAAGAPGLGVHLAVSGAGHSHSAGSPDLVVSLAVSDASHPTTSGTPTLGVVLPPDDSQHGHAAENIDLEQIGVATLTIQGCSHAHAADQAALAVHLTVQGAGHAHAAEQATLSVPLAVQGAGHAHSAGSPVLEQKHFLAVSGSSHAHSTSGITFTTNTILLAQPAAHGHSGGEPPLYLVESRPADYRAEVDLSGTAVRVDLSGTAVRVDQAGTKVEVRR